MLASPAYNFIHDVQTSQISFMYNTINNGPITESFSIYCQSLFNFFFELEPIISCGTESKALVKSRNIMFVRSP